MKSELLTGWRPHYAQEGDISVQCSGEDPEVLQMHSGFIQAAGLIQQENAVRTHRGRETQLTDPDHMTITCSELSWFVLAGDPSPYVAYYNACYVFIIHSVVPVEHQRKGMSLFSVCEQEFYLTKYTCGTVSISNDLYKKTLDSVDTLLDTPVNAHI